MPTINKETCHACGQTINAREISLFNGMVEALFQVAIWCYKNNTYRFTRKDVKHLFKDENQSARFGDWVLFGGLVFKEGRGNYGLNKERVKAFYTNKLSIPIRVAKQPNGTIDVVTRGTIKDVPHIGEFLDGEGNFISTYRGAKNEF